MYYRRNIDEELRREERAGNQQRILINRYRTGQVTKDQIVAAAWLGDPIAQSFDFPLEPTLQKYYRAIRGQRLKAKNKSFKLAVGFYFLPFDKRNRLKKMYLERALQDITSYYETHSMYEGWDELREYARNWLDDNNLENRRNIGLALNYLDQMPGYVPELKLFFRDISNYQLDNVLNYGVYIARELRTVELIDVPFKTWEKERKLAMDRELNRQIEDLIDMLLWED